MLADGLGRGVGTIGGAGSVWESCWAGTGVAGARAVDTDSLPGVVLHQHEVQYIDEIELQSQHSDAELAT